MLFTCARSIHINTDGKELKQALHFRFSFEPRFSEVDKSLFLAPPLRTTSCNVHYSGPILFDNERETWSKSTLSHTQALAPDSRIHISYFPIVNSQSIRYQWYGSTTFWRPPLATHKLYSFSTRFTDRHFIFSDREFPCSPSVTNGTDRQHFGGLP